jgi:hypothetical protein
MTNDKQAGMLKWQNGNETPPLSFGFRHSFVISQSSIVYYLFRFFETALLLIPVMRECSFRKS